MSETLAEVVIPDGIEAVEGWRAWRLTSDGHLASLNGGTTNYWSFPLSGDTSHGGAWETGSPLAAACGCQSRYEYVLTREGRSREWLLEQYAKQSATLAAAQQLQGVTYYYGPQAAIPLVEPPPGFGYVLQQVKHDAPDANCSCGIYAVTDREGVPYSADDLTIIGKVKLWGKIVPGENGWRGQYAYPSELHVTAKQAKQIADYGVPLILTEKNNAIEGTSEGTIYHGAGNLSWKPIRWTTDDQSTPSRLPRRFMIGAGFLNLTFAAYNIYEAFH